jgi:putative GTP pyrophosphokinase
LSDACRAIHYLVKINPDRTRLAEYESFSNAIVEIQVRTILQHAWAEIEHDIQYKSATTIPSEIRRRFMSLAGMLEIADREFQTIQDADQKITDRAREMVDRGDLVGVEITPQALKQFLDGRLGSDRRISDWSYDWTARLLRQLGFRDLKQVETAISQYNDNTLSDLAAGGRQGQVTRFELMLLAALGERFIERHPWRASSWFTPNQKRYLDKYQALGIPTAIYDPLTDLPSTGTEGADETDQGINAVVLGGTEGSNPSPSSGESANHRFRDDFTGSTPR